MESVREDGHLHASHPHHHHHHHHHHDAGAAEAWAPAGEPPAEAEHPQRPSAAGSAPPGGAETDWGNVGQPAPPAMRKSAFKGVSWRTGTQKWTANISVRGKNISLGSFRADEEELAAAAYDQAVFRFFGGKENHARKLNFGQKFANHLEHYAAEQAKAEAEAGERPAGEGAPPEWQAAAAAAVAAEQQQQQQAAAAGLPLVGDGAGLSGVHHAHPPGEGPGPGLAGGLPGLPGGGGPRKRAGRKSKAASGPEGAPEGPDKKARTGSGGFPSRLALKQAECNSLSKDLLAARMEINSLRSQLEASRVETANAQASAAMLMVRERLLLHHAQLPGGLEALGAAAAEGGGGAGVGAGAAAAANPQGGLLAGLGVGGTPTNGVTHAQLAGAFGGTPGAIPFSLLPFSVAGEVGAAAEGDAAAAGVPQGAEQAGPSEGDAAVAHQLGGEAAHQALAANYLSVQPAEGIPEGEAAAGPEGGQDGVGGKAVEGVPVGEEPPGGALPQGVAHHDLGAYVALEHHPPQEAWNHHHHPQQGE